MLLSWLALLGLGLAEQKIWAIPFLQELENPILLKGLLLNAFLFNAYIFSWQQTRNSPRSEFYSLLWNVFITAVFVTMLSVLLTGAMMYLEKTGFDRRTTEVVHCVGFHVEFGAVLFFLMLAFNKWKSIILYEKTPLVWKSWLVFEIGFLLMSITHFFSIERLDAYFYSGYAVFILLAFFLSINLRWIPYLNFRQKVRAIPMLLGILSCLGYVVYSFYSYFSHEPLVVDDISKSLFIAVLFSFVLLYTFISLVSVVYNLPSSSILDQKFKSLLELQQTNGNLLGKSEEETYELLLNSLIDLTQADAAWLESNHDKVFIAKNISREGALQFQQAISEKGYDGITHKNFTNRLFSPTNASSPAYNSVLAIPLKSNNLRVGNLVLLKTMRNAFDTMMVTIANTFTAQASVAIQNHKLVSGAGESASIQEAMLLAKSVQERLLPTQLQSIPNLEVLALNQPAETVGGDYYDLHEISSGKYAVLIADVAGKGITAAFNMAQMKGIFKSLVQTAFTPHEFMKCANVALSGVLEKNVFITASYFLIDTNQSKIYFTRAGHCPTLYYNSKTEEATYFNNQGLGLGIITNDKFERFIEVTEFNYKPDDLLVLYTDGIVEAKHKESGEEYGYVRLQQLIEKHHDCPLTKIGNELVSDVRAMMQSDDFQDDYTLLLIRMK